MQVATPNTESLAAVTTHLVLTEQVACAALVLSIAAAADVLFVTPAFVDDCAKHGTLSPPPAESHHLPMDSRADALISAAEHALWIGRPWSGAYRFWRDRAATKKSRPLYGHRVAVLGQARLRGAARLLVPTLRAVKEILIASGAEVVAEDDADPTFAIISPGLNSSNSPAIARFVEEKVLCLGPAFLVDLIARVSADPSEYVLFESQRPLCGPRLDSSSIPTYDAPLPVTTRSVSPPPIVPPNIPPPAVVIDLCSSSTATDSENACIAMQCQTSTNLKEQEKVETSRAQESKLSNDQTLQDSVSVDHLPQSPRVEQKRSSQSKRVHSNTPKSKKKRESRRKSSLTSKTPSQNLANHELLSELKSDATNSKTPEKPVVSDGSREEKKSPPLCQTTPITPASPQLKTPVPISPKRPRSARLIPATDVSHLKQEGQTEEKEIFLRSSVKADAQNSLADGTTIMSPAIVKEDACRNSLRPNRNAEDRDTRMRELISTAPSLQSPVASDSDDNGPAGCNATRRRLRSSDFNEIQPSQIGNGGLPNSAKVSALDNNAGLSEDNVPPPFVPDKVPSIPVVSSRSLDFVKSHRSEATTCDENDEVADQIERAPRRLDRSFSSVSATPPPSKGLSINFSRHSLDHVTTSDSASFGEKSTSLSNRRRRRLLTRQDSDSDEDALSDAPSPEPQIGTTVDEQTRSVREGYEYVLALIGGEAPERAVKRMLKSINAPKEHWEGIDLEPSEKNGTAVVRGSGFEESPVLGGNEDELAENPDLVNPQLCQRDILNDDGLFRREIDEALPVNSQTGRRQNVEKAVLPVPKRPITLRNIVRSELVFRERANMLNIAPGNIDDDLACQGSVTYGDWLVAAENLVGYTVTEETVVTQNKITSTSRRLWSSLFESRIFERLASPGGLSESQITAVAGVCIRLLTGEFQPDMGYRLLRELLTILDKQKLSGMDSIQILLCSTNVDEISFRHRVIVALWATLLHSFSRQGYEADLARFLDEAIKPSVDELFECARSPDRIRGLSVEAKSESVMDILRLVLFTFAIKLDIFESAESMDIDNFEGLIPENWSVICTVFERFSSEVNSLNKRDTVKVLVTSLLKGVTLKFCGAVWTASEQVLVSISKALAAASHKERLTCYCEQAPLYAAQFDEYDEKEIDVDSICNVLRTPCDFVLFIGQNYAEHGDGNGMKRVMNVIRNAAKFTNASENGAIRAVNHHVGLVLSIAKCIANHGGGEAQVLKMLTSKGLDLLGMLKKINVSGGNEDEKWDILFKAVVVRCKGVVNCHGNVEVYVEWLCGGIVECLGLMRRVAERRTSVVRERETVRVQEGMIHTAALKRVRTLREVLELVWQKVDGRGMYSEVLTKCVEVALEPVAKLFEFCRESISQMRMNCEQATAKNRDLIISEVLDVLELFLKLLAYVCGDTTRDYNGTIGEFVRRQSVYELMINDENDNMAIDMMGCDDLIRDEEDARRVKRSATALLALMVEMRVLTREPGWYGENCEKLVALVRRCKLDILSLDQKATAGIVGGPSGLGREIKDIQDESLVRFWWWAVRSKWVAELIDQNREAKAIVLSIVALMMVCEDCVGTEEGHMIKETRRILQMWPSMSIFVHDWIDNIEDSRAVAVADPQRMCPSITPCVERIIVIMGEEWGRPRTRTLVSQLRLRVLNMIRCNRKAIALDGLKLLAVLFHVESDARGFCSGGGARWMQTWIADICDGLHRIAHAGGGWRRGQAWTAACEDVQQRVMSSLSMVTSDGRDAELRMFVLRLLNAMDAGDDLSGVWTTPVHAQRIKFAGGGVGVTDEMNRRAKRNRDEWRTYAFRCAVDDPFTRNLTGGKSVVLPLKRLFAAANCAARNNFALRSTNSQTDVVIPLAKAVVHRICSAGLQATVERDSTTRVMWRQVCASVGRINERSNED